MIFSLPENHKENPIISFYSHDKRNYCKPKRVKTSISHQWANKIIDINRINRVVYIECGFACELSYRHRNNSKMEIGVFDQPDAKALCPGRFTFGTCLGVDLQDDPIEHNDRLELAACSDFIRHFSGPGTLVAHLKRLVLQVGCIDRSTPKRDAMRSAEASHCPNKAYVREWKAADFASPLQRRRLYISRQKRLSLQKFIFKKVTL